MAEILKQDDVDNLFGDIASSDDTLEDSQERDVERYSRVVCIEPVKGSIQRTYSAWQGKQDALEWLNVSRHLGYNCYLETLFEKLYSAKAVAEAKKHGTDLPRWKIVVHR